MDRPVIQITIRMPEEMRQWLHREANRQMSSTSVLIRQAVLLLQKKIQREGEEDV